MPTDRADRERRERNLKALRADPDLIADTESLNRQLHAWLEGRRLRWLVGSVLLLVVLGFLSVLSIGVVHNVQRLDRLQHADRLGAIHGSYRTCVRGIVARAELQLAADERGNFFQARRRERRYPILDCSPLLTVRDAQPRVLTRRAQRQVVRFYARTYRAPVIRSGRVGRCPDHEDAQRAVTRWRHVARGCRDAGPDLGGNP